jgi:hypothetical protein
MREALQHASTPPTMPVRSGSWDSEALDELVIGVAVKLEAHGNTLRRLAEENTNKHEEMERKLDAVLESVQAIAASLRR